MSGPFRIVDDVRDPAATTTKMKESMSGIAPLSPTYHNPLRWPLNRLIFVLLVMIATAAGASAAAADMPGSADASDGAKRRMERERQFLYRAVEDLNRSQAFVQEAVRGLEKQIDAVELLEPARRERDLRSFLEWYQAYAEWLRSSAAVFEEDLSRAYDNRQGSATLPDRCSALVSGYERLNSQLEAGVADLEKLNDRTQQRIAELRTDLDYIGSEAFIRDRSTMWKKKPEPPDLDRPKNPLFERYKNITDDQIARMQLELSDLVEVQKHYLVLLETGRMELAWVSRRTADYEALGQLSRVIGRDFPEPIEEASSRMIKLYESDMVYFKRKADEISRAKLSLVPAGTLTTLARVEELSDTYDRMKKRFEQHIEWLSGQIGAYRADSIDAGKER